jgi:hypothetical protein
VAGVAQRFEDPLAQEDPTMVEGNGDLHAVDGT